MFCRFARDFENSSADLLGLDKGLKRSFREETITDLMMAGFVRLSKTGSVGVQYPFEPVTGADMEWWFVPGVITPKSRGLHIYVQAKRLSSYGTGVAQLRYPELIRKDRRDPTKRQVDTLCSHALSVNAYPLYAFYQSQTACNAAAGLSTKSMHGVMLADAMLVQALVNSPPPRKSATRLEVMRPIQFPFHELFCPGKSVKKKESAIPLGPSQIRDILLKRREEALESEVFEDSDIKLDPISQLTKIPKDVQSLVGKVEEATGPQIYVEGRHAAPTGTGVRRFVFAGGE